MKLIIPSISLATVVISLSGCKKEAFVEANTDPGIVYTITPQEHFLNATVRYHNSDRIAFYDNFRKIMPWMQMSTIDINGNTRNFISDVGNFNWRYGQFYPEIGAYLTDVQKIIEAKPEEEQPAYKNIHDIAEIMKIQYAFHVSEINGSIPYSEAFLARYQGTLTPAYQTQQELFGLWDTELKEIAASLASSGAGQQSLGTSDLYFQGDVIKWAKVANALRLRIATRWMKRDPAKATEIVTDALASANQMTDNSDGWVFRTDATFTSGGDWAADVFRAPRPTVDFMWENGDPRIRNFYQKNDFSEENFELAKDAGLYPQSATWEPRQYVGAPISPDSALGKYRQWFIGKQVNTSLSLDTISFIQPRMWQPSAVSGTTSPGTGVAFFPVITYADYCFMRAEFIVRGMAQGDAEEWYNNGVTASIQFYDEAAEDAKLPDYVALDQDEITDYLNAPDVKYDAAKGLEQIIVQAYINFFKQPNEAWANFKRTGMPNKNTVLANEDIVIDGTVRQIPRRAQLSAPAPTDQNYDTKFPALEEMAKDPGFGQGPSDAFGRVWWDVQ